MLRNESWNLMSFAWNYYSGRNVHIILSPQQKLLLFSSLCHPYYLHLFISTRSYALLKRMLLWCLIKYFLLSFYPSEFFYAIFCGHRFPSLLKFEENMQVNINGLFPIRISHFTVRNCILI